MLLIGTREVHLVETSTGTVVELELGPAVSREHSPECRLSADGKELVVIDKQEHRRLCFALE